MANNTEYSSDLPRPPRRSAAAPHPHNPFAAHLPITPPCLMSSLPPPTGLSQALGLHQPFSAAPGPAAPDFNVPAFAQPQFPFASQPSHIDVHPQMYMSQPQQQQTWDTHAAIATPHYSVGNPRRTGGQAFWNDALRGYNNPAMTTAGASQHYPMHPASQGLSDPSAQAHRYSHLGGYSNPSVSQPYPGIASHQQPLTSTPTTSAPVQELVSSTVFADSVPLAAGASTYVPSSSLIPSSATGYGEDYLYNNDIGGAASVLHMSVLGHPSQNESAVTHHHDARYGMSTQSGLSQPPRRGGGLVGKHAQQARMKRAQSRAASSGPVSYANQTPPTQSGNGRYTGGPSRQSEVVQASQSHQGSDNSGDVAEEMKALESLSPKERVSLVHEATVQSVEFIEVESPRASGLERGSKTQNNVRPRWKSQSANMSNCFLMKDDSFGSGRDVIGLSSASESCARFSAPVEGASALFAGESSHVPVVDLEVGDGEGTKHYSRGGASVPGRTTDMQVQPLPMEIETSNGVTIADQGKLGQAWSGGRESVERRKNGSVEDLMKSSASTASRGLTLRTSPRRRAARVTAEGSMLRSSLVDDVAGESSRKIKISSRCSDGDALEAVRGDVPLGALDAPGVLRRQAQNGIANHLTYAPGRTRKEVPEIDFDSNDDGAGVSHRDKAVSRTPTGKSRKGRRSAPAALKDSDVGREEAPRPTRRSSQRIKASTRKDSAQDYESIEIGTDRHSPSDEDITVARRTQKTERRGKKNRKGGEVGDGFRGKSRRNDSVVRRKARVPILSFDDDEEGDDTQRTSVFDENEEDYSRATSVFDDRGKEKRTDGKCNTAPGNRAKRQRSVFEDDDVGAEKSSLEDHGDDANSDDDFIPSRSSIPRRNSTPEKRGNAQTAKRRKTTPSALAKRSGTAQKRSSPRGKTSPSIRRKSGNRDNEPDQIESHVVQSEGKDSDDDETDGDAFSPSQPGSQGISIVVKALTIKKKRTAQYPEHLWTRMTSEELSTIRLGFVKYYPTPPSNMHAQGRFEQQYMREMPKSMAEALWKTELKPWSDRWWQFFMMFGDFAREKKKQKPLGRNPTLKQPEVDRWAKEFHSKYGDARLPAAASESTETIAAN